ncbi:unnamed protein product [Ectocarpus sp. 12 AP-2014]
MLIQSRWEKNGTVSGRMYGNSGVMGNKQSSSHAIWHINEDLVERGGVKGQGDKRAPERPNNTFNNTTPSPLFTAMDNNQLCRILSINSRYNLEKEKHTQNTCQTNR